MKKLLLALLMVCLMVVPAYAEEISDQTTEDSLQESYVAVGTLDELQKAIAVAEEGDTIFISSGITIWEDDVVETDKSIVLKRDTSFSGGPLIYIGRNGILKGFTIIDTNSLTNTLQMMDSATVQNCHFIGSENHYGKFIYVCTGALSETSAITDCSFVDNGTIAIECGYGTDAICNKCVFSGNMSYAIYNCGNMRITDCTITQNWHSGICGYKNVTTINNCQIYGNIPCNPQDRSGADLCIEGTLIIEGKNKESEGYFDEITGTKIELPFEYYGVSKMIYLTDEQAIEHFAPPLQDAETDPSNPGDDSGNADNPPESPQEPGDQPGNNNPMGEQPSQEPTDPPQNDAENNPVDDNLPQEPETPQQPQEPPQSGNANDDDYTPPTDYRPSQRPMWPATSTSKPTEPPQLQPDVSAEKPQLICNGAVIDAAKTIVLFGYGDGQLHEADSLTRAQLATIIYRLLDDGTIARYSRIRSIFADVAADSWYAPYVNIIGAVGIVNGVGAGQYDPDGVVTWAQIITILSRFVEAQEIELQYIQYDGWATPALKTAVALGWIKDSATFNPDAIISRGELVQLVNSVLALYR